ncbi:sugar phosphate isomerase/epimerase [Halalkalicoccus sp. NIPERK01]|uniref:sugar phosphate isomerase/epimerase family protein n=1 Tax=Halalkalicoccus sp. NIPERK01 TaxID=3053469 RepID=UPI00256E9E11|nr:sugar phosphate isomerase/epimerase family protein [Halalkalicoccus sp. NIPERK01]MDL5363164.1 sugar phosphate isomerase/epimerase family protein [Halalkalicoccus sp. NIPERK01]
MRYGLNQCGFPVDEFEHTCAILAEIGYDGVEPNVERGGPLTTEQGRLEAAEIVEEHDLRVPAVSTISHWEYPLSSSDDELRRIGLTISRDMIDAAAMLDAEDVLIVPAVITDGATYDADYERAVEAVREIASYAAERDVRVSIENVQNNFLPSPDEFAAFLDDVEDADPIGAYFDVVNALRSGLPSRWLHVLDGRISKIHVKDWLTDAHCVTYPPQGDVNWERVLDAVDAIGYDGWITAEVPAYQSFPTRMPVDMLGTMQFLFEDGGDQQ